MNNTYSQHIHEFLLETEPYISNVNSLPFETAIELYDLIDEAAKAATLHINEIDPEYRVALCDRQDQILERIVDEMPPFEHTGEQLRVYAPSLIGYRRWNNFELLKDCGLVPYFLAKELNAKPVMYFGTQPSDYPYLNDLPGMEMHYHDREDGLEEAYKNFMVNNFSKMDVLVFYGMYNQSISYLDGYRQVRPDGKVYCGLDMNFWWMDQIVWDSIPGKQFSEQCDIIATSCRMVRDALNRNPTVHFPCRWFTNGFFNPTGSTVVTNAEIKENIILTVGRIGTKQKNNEELLTAFAEVSDSLNGWSLRLVGPIEHEFQSYINNYFLKYPQLKSRVIFTGSIVEKAELYSEYAKAKIFALTSMEEGFPNVYAEALFHGCMFITSEIEAADDMINYGELGYKYPIEDIDALKSTLIDACSKVDIKMMREHIPKALVYANKFYDWNRNAKKLAYMLFK